MYLPIIKVGFRARKILGAGFGVKIYKIGAKKLLLLIGVSRRIFANLLLPRFMSGRFQHELQREQELEAILKAKLVSKT